MTSPLALFATSKESRRRNQAIYLEYAELGAVENHPAMTARPPAWKFDRTDEFLRESADIEPAVEQVALRLDQDWPDWAATRTNVFSVILNDVFFQFIPWLEAHPSKNQAINAGMRFERHLFAQAEARHSIYWWRKQHIQTPSWFHVSETGEKMRMYAGHPVIQSKARSWRCYHQYMVAHGWDLVNMVQEEWVYV